MVRCSRAVRVRQAAIGLALLIATAWLSAGGACAHAFMSRSDPRAGTTVAGAPASVRVWFDGPIEPLFAVMRIENARKQRVDTGGARVDPANNTLLELTLPSVGPGRYRVYWSVIARDGHPKDGDFSFTVR